MSVRSHCNLARARFGTLIERVVAKKPSHVAIVEVDRREAGLEMLR